MKLSTALKYGLAMAVVFGIALFLRIYFPYHNVFRDGWVNFQETDCWYNMRQLVSLAQHFPHRNLFDPYGFYPGGMAISSPPFFYLLLGFFAWVLGAGSPTQHLIEIVGAYLPAIMGALITVPVYFIGKELFNRKAGLIGATLIAILPGQFLWRSMLGFPDYHVAETLFSALTMMFLMIALRRARDKGVSFQSLRDRDWAAMRKPLIYSLVAGIALGLYLLTWSGSGLFIFIIFVFAVIQFVVDHLRGRSTDYLCIVTGLSFFIALIMVATSWNGYSGWDLQFTSLIIGIIVFLALGTLSSLMSGRHMKRAFYPLALVALGGIGAALFYVADPSLFNSILDKTSVFRPAGGMLTVAEVKGLTLSSAWYQFTTDFYLALIAMAILVYLIVKEGTADKTLLFVWSLIVLLATFGQNRFSYYFAVNVALLTGYLSWRVLQFAGLRESTEGIAVAEDSRGSKIDREWGKAKRSKKAKRKKAKAEKREQGISVTRYLSARNVYISVTLIVVFFLAFYPNIGVSIDRVEANTGVSDDWHESLVWMKANTPDPFQNPDLYYKLQIRPASGEAYQYPESAYGVMSWWDYGYSITYIAHRIPNANPGRRGYEDAASFFTAQDETSSQEVLDRLWSKYVIIDFDMAMGKFYAMVAWSGKNVEDFFDVYYWPQSGSLVPQRLYLPAYYRSMCSRLYNFGGEAWVPSESNVISWKLQDVIDTEGNSLQVKVISDTKSFNSYKQAQEFLSTHTDYIMVGKDPFVSPVPLDELDHYQLIHKSPTTTVTLGNDTISYVEIFEHLP
jgi:oligosaccharyl transferase (archaeosortase A-associated)